MSASLRVVAFLGALALVFGIAMGVGNAVGPLGDVRPTHEGADHGSADESGSVTTPSELPGGLMVSQDGYTLRLRDTATSPGRDVPVAFTIEGPDGQPVTSYDVEHEKRLHLIAVRRDFAGFQHVHPTLDDRGTWSTELDLTPGPWRVFADFTASGADALTLGSDLQVGGDHEPDVSSDEIRTVEVDGYTVTVAGALTPGTDSELTLNVTKDGVPVTDLEPYLGAYGHLVTLREGDLAYLHVHPDGAPGDGRTEPGPAVVFYASVPSDGTYRLFLDFKHDGVVRTAAFTIVAAASGSGEESAHKEEGEDEHSD